MRNEALLSLRRLQSTVGTIATVELQQLYSKVQRRLTVAAGELADVKQSASDTGKPYNVKEARRISLDMTKYRSMMNTIEEELQKRGIAIPAPAVPAPATQRLPLQSSFIANIGGGGHTARVAAQRSSSDGFVTPPPSL